MLNISEKFLTSIFFLWLTFLCIVFQKKLVLIRTSRIGHMVGNVDFYLSGLNENEIENVNENNIYIYEDKICNEAVFKILGSIFLFRSRVINKYYFLTYFIMLKFNLKKFIYNLPVDQGIKFEINKCPQILFPLEEHLSCTEEFLEKHNIKEFVVSICRDQNYLNKTFPELDFSYHDFRNADASVYFSGVNKFCENFDIICIKMGIHTLPITGFKNIFDYSNLDHNDCVDVGLAAKCLLFSHSNSGFSSLPRAFRRPMVALNVPHVNYAGSNVECYTPKLLFSRERGCLLDFSEMVNSPFGYAHDSAVFVSRGIDLVENSPDEISAAMEEAFLRSRNLFTEDPYVQEVNHKIWQSLERDDSTPARKARVSEYFIKKHYAIFERI